LCIARQSSWHVVCASNTRLSQVHGWRDTTADFCSCAPTSQPGGDNTIVLDAMKESAAIIVLQEFSGGEPCPDLIAKLREALGGTSPPIVVLILPTGIRVVPDNIRPVLQAQEKLVLIGADDVLWKLSGRMETRVMISQSVLGVFERRRADRQLESHICNHYEQELRQLLSATEESRLEPMQGMFWKAIHKTFEGFPRLRQDVDSSAGPGSQIGQCRLQEVLGKGTFGTVYAAVNSDCEEMQAVKVIEKESLRELDDVIALWKEMRFLTRMRHKNIVALRGTLHGPCHIFMAMDRAGTHTLFRVLKDAGGRFSLERSRDLQGQLSSAIAHCHCRGVVHRDLKPENIAMNDEETQLKVLDFGSAASVGKLVHDIVGTMPFMAPEVMVADEDSPYDPAPSDVWSMGVIVLEMLCGVGRMERLVQWDRTSYPCEDRTQDLSIYFSDHAPLLQAMEASIGEHLGPDLSRLMCGMLEVSQAHRWTAEHVAESRWLPQRPRHERPAERNDGIERRPSELRSSLQRKGDRREGDAFNDLDI